jgi:metal-responsive CopG/Arc/MetJ family transcriptional regulator
MSKKRGAVSITVNEDLLYKIDKMGIEENRSRSNTIETIMQRYFSKD